jgi:hypothetical protein
MIPGCTENMTSLVSDGSSGLYSPGNATSPRCPTSVATSLAEMGGLLTLNGYIGVRIRRSEGKDKEVHSC